MPPSRVLCMASRSAAPGVRREHGERTSVGVPHASPPSGVCEVPTGGATIIAAVLAPIAAVVTAIGSPVMTVLDDGRGTNDGRGPRDRSTTEYSHPASTSWA